MKKDNSYKVYQKIIFLIKNLVYKVQRYIYFQTYIFKCNSRNFDWQPEWVENWVALFPKAWKIMQGAELLLSLNHLKQKLWKCGGKKNNFLYILSSFYNWKILNSQLKVSIEKKQDPEVYIMQIQNSTNQCTTIIKWQLKNHSFMEMNEWVIQLHIRIFKFFNK